MVTKNNCCLSDNLFHNPDTPISDEQVLQYKISVRVLSRILKIASMGRQLTITLMLGLPMRISTTMASDSNVNIYLHFPADIYTDRDKTMTRCVGDIPAITMPHPESASSVQRTCQ